MSVKVRAVAPTSSDQMFRALEVQTKLRSRFEHSSGRTMYRSEIRVGVHQVARQSSFGHNHSVITISHGGRRGKMNRSSNTLNFNEDRCKCQCSFEEVNVVEDTPRGCRHALYQFELPDQRLHDGFDTRSKKCNF